ncbi:MAG TPA: tetratricopeptide repeat protein [Polyangiaceae bacterium]|nr:tetratricopeptide repeat protein [Polyangiaceae bacterium]
MTDASLFEIALQFHQAGQLERAERFYRRALERTPDHGDALFLLGGLALESGRLEEAAALLRRAVQVDPNHAFYLMSLGEAYRHLGRRREAVAALLMAVARKPDLAEAVLKLASSFEEQGDLAAAAECYERALVLDPHSTQAAARLASLKDERHQPAASGGPVQARSTELGMSAAELLAAVAETLRLGGRTDHAAAWYQIALKLNPRMANAYTALGAIQANAGHFDRAIDDFRRALEVDENCHQARSYLATALDETGRLDETQSLYRQAVSLCPDSSAAHSALLFNMPFWPNVSASDILAEARAWNARHARPLAAQALPHENDRSPERRLRIGYVSPDFQTHVQSLFTIPLLQNHDHQQFEIFCYSSGDKPSDLTARIRGYADVFREVGSLDDAALSELIRQDRIDISIDLTMHMTGCRLLAFARRPAPVQLCWLAYPGTTGLETMDYRLSDPFLDPPSTNDDVYSEETIRLPDSFWCYDPLTDVPEVSSLPALALGKISFGCLNHFRKVNDAVLRLWATVLTAVPDSRLLLMAPQGTARDRVRSIFARANVALERIEFVDRSGRLDYLQRYREIDICLDTFPSNGHTTSLDALWMGVPTVTLAGTTVVGRAGVCQAMNLALPELITTTSEQYVALARSLASDLERLSELRRTLRDRLKQSPLMDGARFARNLEAIYRDVWRRFCATSERRESTKSERDNHPQE